MLRPKNCKKCGGKMQTGGLQPYTQSNTQAGSTTPTGQSSLINNSQMTPAQIQALAQQFGFRTDSNQNLQTDLYNYALQNQPQAYNQVMSKYGQTNAGTFADGMLGARTTDLLSALTVPKPVPPTPQPQRAALTEHFFGPDKHALGMASQRYRDSQSITDPGLVNTADPQEWVDFQYYQPNSANIDESRGRYRIPNSVWSNQITRGTTTIQDPSLIEQYRINNSPLTASATIKMKGGRITRMQAGGAMPKQSDFPDYETYSQALDAWMAQQSSTQQAPPPRIDLSMFMPNPADEPLVPGVNAPYPDQTQQTPQYNDRIQEGIAKGIIEAPKDWNGTAMEWYNFMNTNQPQKKNNKTPQNTLQNIGITLRGLRTVLGEIAGRVERGRQNQYDWQQQTALGQMNPMPTTDFQPNPYSLYAKYGGSLKKYQNGGMPNPLQAYWANIAKTRQELQPQPSYSGLNSWSGQPATRDDSLTYNNNFQRALTMSPQAAQAQATRAAYTQFNAQDPIVQNMAANESSAFNDAVKQKQAADAEFINRIYLGKPAVSRKPMKYGGLQNVNYFGPPFSNGAKMSMGDNEKIDKALVTRMVIPKLFKMSPYRDGKFSMSMKKGGIHIKPENKGKFTDYCGGKVTDECIQKGLNSPSATIRKRANFARNARSWN